MTALTIILGLLPGFAWLYFYLKEDLHPEPKRLIILVFLAGIAFAFMALLSQIFLNMLFSSWKPPDWFRISFSLPFAESTIPLFSAASILIFAALEELFKFGAAYSTVYNEEAFDEPVDAMIYAVVAALGFATLENVGAITFGDFGGITFVNDIFEVASLRFVGATLLHALSSAIVGYFWALSIREFGLRKILFKGLLIATGLHVFFNYLIISYGTMVYPVVFLTIVGFFVLGDFEKLRRKAI